MLDMCQVLPFLHLFTDLIWSDLTRRTGMLFLV